MAPPKDIARSYPKRGLTADVGFRSEPKFCGDGSTSLDGTSDYLESTLTTALGSGFSVSLWFLKRSTTGSNNYLMSSGSAGGGSFISLSCTAANALAVYDQSLFLTSSLTADLNQWHHAVLTVGTGANSYTVYLDGISESLANTASPNITNGDFELGRYSLGNTHYHDGLVSDVRIYDQVLTQDQVREIYNNPGLTIPTGLSASNLRHRYKLETDYVDTGASGDDLTAFGSPSFTVNRPQLPRGLDLARGVAMARVYTGRALDQDGSVDRLQGANFTDATATACTVSFWMYQRDGGPGRIIHNFGGGATAVDRFIAFMSSSSFYIAGEITSGNRLGFTLSSLPLNQWHHVVFVLDGNGTTSLNTTILYLNGEKYDSPGAVGVIWDTTTFDIGGTSHGYQNQLIAGVKVFNMKFTDAQARELYHNPEQVLPTGVSASNLRRYYPLSDYNDTGGTGGRYFQDMGADGEPVEDIGSCSMEFAQPVPCPQLGLQQSASRISMQDTTNNTYYRSDVMSGTPFTNQGTLSGWFIMQELPGTTSGDYNPIFILGKYPGGDMLEIVYDNDSGHGTPNIWLSNGGGSVSVRYNHTFELGKLQHVVITTLATSPYWQLWINGEKKTVSARSFSGSRTTWSFGDNKLSGGRWGDGPYGGVCHFIPVDTAAWNTVLSDSEVTQVYNSGIPGDVSGIASANLQAWWKCDDLTSFKDYSGNGVSGAVTVGTIAPGLASFPENASGSTIVGDFSMKRKGVSVLNLGAVSNAANEYALSAKDSAFLPSFANGGAFSCFFRLQKLGEFSSIFINDDYGSGTQHRFAVYLNSANKVYFELGDGVSARANPNTTGTISDSDWHHFAFTVDYGGGSTTTIKLFLDGVLDSTSTATTLAGVPNATALRFGDYVTSGANEMNGPIACPKFYQVTLSDNEIEQIYRSDLRLIKGLANE